MALGLRRNQIKTKVIKPFKFCDLRKKNKNIFFITKTMSHHITEKRNLGGISGHKYKNTNGPINKHLFFAGNLFS